MPEFAGIRQIESWAVAISAYVWVWEPFRRRQQRFSTAHLLSDRAHLAKLNIWHRRSLDGLGP